MNQVDLIEKYKKDLDLTSKQAAMYEFLLAVGAQRAKTIASEVKCLPHAVYRLAKDLERKGYVATIRHRPLTYQAVPYKTVIENHQKQQSLKESKMFGELIGANIPEPDGQQAIEILTGREALYEYYATEAEQAKSEILIFAIGIAYDQRLKKVQTRAIKRGVEIRHIVQKMDPENYHVLHTWKQLGAKLRYYPVPLGFHLMIFDSQTVIITLSNPENTDERSSIILNQTAAAQTLRDYFYTLWSKSQLVKV